MNLVGYKKGKIAYVNLLDEYEQIRLFDYSDKFLHNYLGSRGFNAFFMYKFRNTVPQDALDPQNLLMVSAGLFAGTRFPSSGRTTVSVLKSPVTGLFGDGNLGGHFGPALRLAGIDALIIDGSADRPVYLWIHDQTIMVRGADDIWNCGVNTADAVFRHRHGENVKPLIIGPAGAQKVFCAVPICENRVPGGGGAGAVMGSKNLKAIVVDYEPHRYIGSARPDKFKEVSDEAENRIKRHPVFDTFSKYGTTSLVEVHSSLNYFPTRNFTSTAFSKWKHVSGKSFLAKWRKEDQEYDKKFEQNKEAIGCRNCPIVCSNPFKIEYETINCLGAKLGITSPDEIQYLNLVYLNDGGLDVIQATSIIAALMQMFEEGMSSYRINWGEEYEVRRFLFELYSSLSESKHQTPARFFRNGFLEGVREVYIGPNPGEKTYLDLMDRYYVNVKGMGLSGVVPSDKNKGVALAVATASRGGDHLRSLPTLATYASWYLGKKGFRKLLNIAKMPLRALSVMKGDAKFLVKDLYSTYVDVFGVPKQIVNTWKSLGFLLDQKQTKGWGHMIKFTQEMYALSDSISICRFITPWRFGIGPEVIGRAIHALTGQEIRWDQLLKIGARVNALEKWLSWTRYDNRPKDTLPPRFFQGIGSVNQVEFNAMLEEYYERCGYDENGKPKNRTLAALLQNSYERIDAEIAKTILRSRTRTYSRNR